jgi:hypothetical protein
MGADQARNAGPEGAEMIAGFPEWSAQLRELYWQLRIARKTNEARLRKAYRLVRRERDRLESLGHDPELLRLFCRWAVNPKNELADLRWRSYSVAVQAAAGVAAQALARASANTGGMGAVAPHIASAANRTVQRIACLAVDAANDDIAPYRQGGG